MTFGISWWKADRCVRAGHALERLPKISEAFAAGRLSIDKVVELTRFATPETERRLLRWAAGVSAAAIRRRADVECRPEPDEAAEAERGRYLEWWWLEGGLRLGLEAQLPAVEGAALVRAIEAEAASVPVMPGEDDAFDISARRADALVSLCTSGSEEEAKASAATVMIHVQAASHMERDRHAEVEGGGVAHPTTLQRVLCSARTQAVLEDGHRNALALGRASREPSSAMMRALRYRDGECRFPGCGSTRFLRAHHLV
jgi:hypothetical protein